MLTFLSAPNHVWHPPQGLGKRANVNLHPPKNVNLLPQLTDFFQNPPNPQNPPRVLPVNDVIHIPGSTFLSGIFILTFGHYITSFSWTNSALYIYHLVVWSKFNLLNNSQWIIFPTQSCLVMYSFCACLLHLLTTILIVSSPHNLHLLFCCKLSIFALT